MAEAYIRVRKKLRESQRSKYPNLAKSPVYIPVQNFSTKINFRELPETEIQEFIEDLFESQGMRTSPDKYPFEGKETVDLVLEGSEKIFEGKVEIPKKYRGEDAENDAIFN